MLPPSDTLQVHVLAPTCVATLALTHGQLQVRSREDIEKDLARFTTTLEWEWQWDESRRVYDVMAVVRLNHPDLRSAREETVRLGGA